MDNILYLAILECNVGTLLYEEKKKERFKPLTIKAQALFIDKTIGKCNSLT